MINYVLIWTAMQFPSDGTGSWQAMRIEKMHSYITECLDEGQHWHQRNIQDALAAHRHPFITTWQCVPISQHQPLK